MIHIVAVLTAKSGHRAGLLTAFMAIIPAVRAEPGCIEYQAVIDLESSAAKFGADAVVVIEKWEDQASLDAHNQGAALRGFLEASKHLLAQADVYLLQAAAGRVEPD
jgi:quinol monooxygenase YgiN